MSLTRLEIKEVTKQEPVSRLKAALRAIVQTNVPNTKHVTQETCLKNCKGGCI